MRRRTFLHSAALCGSLAAQNQTSQIPVIDTHIHLFDPRRPQGIPWPPKDNQILYKPALPPRFRSVSQGHRVVGAIEVEASPWFEDNQWVLDVCEGDPIMVGFVGNVDPGAKEFGKNIEQLRKNPLFLGIRFGNLWNRDLSAELDKPVFVAGLKLLADAGLTLDSANPNPKLLEALRKVSDLAPKLRIVVDHLPNMKEPAKELIADLGKRPQVFVKVSEVLQANDQIAKIDEIYTAFGEDRVLYGSDWPNSDPHGTYADVVSLVKKYFAAKGKSVSEKYFWKNSVRAYRWKARTDQQRALLA